MLLKQAEAEFHKKVGERIRVIRMQRKMSQADLAERAQIALSHISDIELGKKRMLLVTFNRVVEALQVSADTLLRSNVPEVNHLYQHELYETLSDCSPTELDSILRIVKEVKISLKQARTEDED